MQYGLIRCYHYLEEDADKVLDKIAESCRKAGMDFSLFDKTVLGVNRVYYVLRFENIQVLVIKLFADEDWLNSLEELDKLERDFSLLKEDILGRTTILTAFNQEYEKFWESSRVLIGKARGYSVEINGGKLTRFPKGFEQVHYLATVENYNTAMARFFEYYLPLLEARLIKLSMTCSLYRERIPVLMAQNTELNSKLSDLLHSNLVAPQALSKEAQELEIQIQELSSSYGVIAANLHIIMEGRHYINTLLNSVLQYIKHEPIYLLKESQLNQFVQPFQNILEKLCNAEKHLNTSRENYQAAIEVVRSKIDIMNSRANIATQEKMKNLMELNTAMQKQSLVFQYAAGLIEFIILAYYSHSLWKNLANNAYVIIPAYIQFLFVIALSAVTVYCTHLLAEYFQGDRNIRKKMIVALIILIILVATIISATVYAVTIAPIAGGH